MSCFGDHDEQIYLIEILIDKLTLTPSKIKDISGHPVVIKIKLLDFPVLEFEREDSREFRYEQDVFFMFGRCCMFIKRPRDLVEGLRLTCMKIGVFRANDTYPTAETELTLPGCLCDQIGMLGNDARNQPKPFTVKGGFNLLDPGENPSGTLYLELVVACLGRCFLPHHELNPKVESHEEEKEREIWVRRFVSPEFLRPRIPEKPKEEEKKPKKKKEKKKKKKKKGKK
jgi:hypothetical protein